MRRMLLALVFALLAVPASAVNLAWDAPASGPSPTGYRVKYGPMSGAWTTTVDVGLTTTAHFDLLPGPYFFIVVAYNAVGESSPSNEVMWTQANACSALQVAVKPPPLGWSALVRIGEEGYVDFRIVNPQPVVDVQVRFGSQVVGHATARAPGDDLRAIRGLSFSVPRVAGDYPMTVWAKDTTNCETVTTLQRIVTVHDP